MWIITAWQCISPEINVKGFRKCWIGLMICCGLPVKRMGMLDVSVRKTMALTVKMEGVTLIGKDK